MIRELEFKFLCEGHSDEIYRYARALLANQADAEDATQEVLLRLWRHLPRVNPFNLRAWLLQTTRCYCLDQIRRRSHKAAPLSLQDGMLEDQPDEFAVDPSLAADSSLRLEQAREALLKLPENLRSVFVLYEVNGLRYREIARTLGIPLNSVKVYLSRAREKLSNLTGSAGIPAGVGNASGPAPAYQRQGQHVLSEAGKDAALPVRRAFGDGKDAGAPSEEMPCKKT